MPTPSLSRTNTQLSPRTLESWLATRAPESVVGYAREGDQSVIGRFLVDQGLPVVYVDGKRALLAGDGQIDLPPWARQLDYEIDCLDDPARASTPVTAKTALGILKTILLTRRLEGLAVD